MREYRTRNRPPPPRLTAFLIAAMLFHASNPPAARAGGGPENVLILIDPANPESRYIGNYYKNARGIPDRNIVYMDPLAANYTTFASTNLDAFFGTLAQNRIDDHIDYVIIMPGPSFYLDAPGHVTDSCSAVSRFAAPSGYTAAFIENEILAGVPVSLTNQYSITNDSVAAFDSGTSWLNGAASTNASARRYFLGAMLGYTGLRGNTLTDITAMIDRSAAADGTRPTGNFYFMQTTDNNRSGPRHASYPGAVSSIVGFGGAGQHLMAVLPTGRTDCLGIMTGWADPDIDNTLMTIRPGAFCDHLTSWAATFDIADQVKMSRWIAKGASGSVGAVQEPCNYAGKFPAARMHVYYYQGLSLGEVYFRSARYVPFQMLLYGDPLTQPFAYLPSVQVNDAPAGSVTGAVTLTPTATTAKPGAAISQHELFVDGVRRAQVANGVPFILNTTRLADGRHEIRVVSTDNTPVASQGRWVGTLNVSNFGRIVGLSGSPPTGDRSTLFQFNVDAGGGTVAQVRLLHNQRVVAAANGPAATFRLLGDVLGAGSAKLFAEAEYTDGRRALSPPVSLNIAYANPPAGGSPNRAPVAYSYTKDIPRNEPILIELPAADQEDSPLSYTTLTAPAQGALTGTGPVRLLRPNAGAAGTDTFTFNVGDGQVTSNTATVTLRYLAEQADVLPPQPDPAQFGVQPTASGTDSILMSALGAADLTSPPVEYMFDFVAGGAGGDDSPWQANSVYNDFGLSPNADYQYRVRSRDSATPVRNMTDYSTPAATATRIETPTGIQVGTITANSVQLTVLGPLTNLSQGMSGIYFDTDPPGRAGGGINQWQQTRTATATGLTQNTAYRFVVKARNRNGLETPVGPAVDVSTISGGGGNTDCNGNGVYQYASDIPCFISALMGVDTVPPGGIARSDLNGDGRTNGLDVGFFVNCILRGCL